MVSQAAREIEVILSRKGGRNNEFPLVLRIKTMFSGGDIKESHRSKGVYWEGGDLL